MNLIILKYSNVPIPNCVILDFLQGRQQQKDPILVEQYGSYRYSFLPSKNRLCKHITAVFDEVSRMTLVDNHFHLSKAEPVISVLYEFNALVVFFFGHLLWVFHQRLSMLLRYRELAPVVASVLTVFKKGNFLLVFGEVEVLRTGANSRQRRSTLRRWWKTQRRWPKKKTTMKLNS